MVDSADKRRLEDCCKELHTLLTEEKLAGASLLVFANKQVNAERIVYAKIKSVPEGGGS